MDVKAFPALIVGVVVALVLMGAVLPGFVSASDSAGDQITKTNIGTKHTFKQMADGDTFALNSTWASNARTDVWLYNNEPIVFENVPDLTWDWGIISNVLFTQVNSPSNSAAGRIDPILDVPGSPQYIGASSSYTTYNITWEYNNHSITQTSVINNGSPTVKVYDNVDWAYCPCSLADGAYMSAQITTNTYFAKEGDKNIILAGNYTTGDLDTGYYYSKDGNLTVVNTGYTGTVNFNQTLSSGTTDIYDTLVSVTITDGSDSETFSPYRALVPYEVEGHANSGALYSLLQILPLLIGAGLVTGAVAWFITRKK